MGVLSETCYMLGVFAVLYLYYCVIKLERDVKDWLEFLQRITLLLTIICKSRFCYAVVYFPMHLS